MHVAIVKDFWTCQRSERSQRQITGLRLAPFILQSCLLSQDALTVVCDSGEDQ